MESSSKEVQLQKRKNLLLGILSVIFFIATGYGVQRTILATIVENQLPFNLWFFQGGWITVAFTLAGAGLFKTFAGFFSSSSYAKKLGTRKVIQFGTISFTAGSGILFLSQQPLLLSIGNCFLGTGEGLLYAAAMIYLSDITDPSYQAQIIGVMELSVYGGYSLGAFVAGIIGTTFSFTFSFIMAILGTLFSFFGIVTITKTKRTKEIEQLRIDVKNTQQEPLGKLLFKPTVLSTMFTGHVSKMVDSIVVLYLPLLLLTFYGYQLSIEETGLITAAFTLAWGISMPATGRISDRIGRKKPILIGLLLESIALFALQWDIAPTIILISFAFIGGVGVGLYYPVLPSIIVDIASDDEKAQLVSLYRAIKDLGFFTGPLLTGMLVQIWYDTGMTFFLLIHLPLAIAGFMLLVASGLILLTYRETHPGWAQFHSTLHHATLVEECVVQATKGIIVYLEQDTYPDHSQGLTTYSLRAKELEVKADNALEVIAIQAYQQLHSSPDAGDFLRIARRLDRVGGLTLGALFRLQMIPLDEIPSLVQEKLHNAVILLRALVRTTVDVLRVLNLQIDAVTGVYRNVREQETELDLLYQLMNRQLFISAQELHYGTWIAIRDVVNMIEQAADSAEDAAEVINILAVKYRT